MKNAATKRTCIRGHVYYKTTDCTSCPVCEKEKTAKAPLFMQAIGSPARRALQAHGIKTLQQLSRFSEKELLKLHGLGHSAIPKLKLFLKNEGLSLKK